MDGKLKKIDGVFVVGTTKSVFIDGTNKTLQEAIDNGELGGTTTATTSGRGYVNVKLRGGLVYVYDIPTSNSSITKIGYKFPTGDTNRERRMFVWTPTGGIKSIDIPDGELKVNEGLVYNFDNNKLETRYGTWGNVVCGNNEILLLYNDLGASEKIGGILSPYVKKNETKDIVCKELEFAEVSTNGNPSSQGMFIIGDYMYLFGHSSDDKVTMLGDFNKRSISNLNVNVASGKHNLGHMNAPSYDSNKDMMIVANGSKIYDQSSLPMEGYVFYNFKNVIENETNLVFDDLDKTIIDLSMFTGEFKAQLCWGYGDYVYLLTSESRIVRKLKLGKGTNKLANGTYTEETEDRYNGTFEIINEWRSVTTGIIGGMKFYKGVLYIGIKGEYGIQKIKFATNGNMLVEYIKVSEQVGTMQGLDVKDGVLYAFTDSKGYSINLIDTLY